MAKKYSKKFQAVLERIKDVDTSKLRVEDAPAGRFVEVKPGGLEEAVTKGFEAQSLSMMATEARKQAGYTMQKVGEVMGVSKARVSQIEAEGINLTIETFRRYINALGADLEIRVVPRDGKEPIVTRLG